VILISPSPRIDFCHISYQEDKCGIVGAKKKLSIRRCPLHVVASWANRERSRKVALEYPSVLARAYRGEPLRRVVVEHTDRAAFLVSPNSLAAFVAGEIGSAGFPIEDVFEFDDALYQRLREQWERESRTDEMLWRSARPYAEPRAA
jgi:hypothetical protein